MRLPQFPWSRYPSMGADNAPGQRRRWWLILAGVAGALLVLGTVGYWAMGRWVIWSEQRNLRQAESAFLAQDYWRAQLLIEQAVQVNPRNLDARRRLAGLYEQFGLPQALGAWREVVELEPANDDLRYGMATCALRLGQPTAAREALAGVSTSGRKSLEFHRLAAGVALLAADRTALEGELAAMARLDPGDARARFNLAATQLVSPDPATAASGRAELIALARGDAMRIRATIELMKFSGRGSRPEAAWRELAHAVLPRPTRTAGWFELIEHMKEQPAAAPADAAALVDWMGTLGLAREALLWLASLDDAVQAAEPVRLARADCAVRLRNWTLLQGLVNTGVWGPVSPDVVALAFAALVQRERASVEHARATWDDALNLAQKSLPALRVVLRLSGDWAWPETTKATLWRIVKKFPNESFAWRALATGAEADGDSAEAWEVANGWRQAQPDDRAAQAHAQWLGVLLGQADDALKTAAGASLAQPDAVPEACAAGAWLLIRAGRLDAARAALAPREGRLASAPRAALVYGELLSQTGQREASEHWLAAAAAAKLLPEEHSILERARARNAGDRTRATPASQKS